MTQASSIEWTDATWNATRGCSMARGSETGGCLNCYAARMAARFPWGKGFARMTENGPRWTGRVELVPSALDWPLRYKGHPRAKAAGRPTRIFVNSTSDLFHEALPDEDIDRVFAVMAQAPQHTFQILTKRPARMRAYALRVAAAHEAYRAAGGFDWASAGAVSSVSRTSAGQTYHAWPLPNVWLGTSVEDQATANERISLLLQTSAAVRFVSYEPGIGPVDVEPYLWDLGGAGAVRPSLGWMIVGGESGPGSRRFDPEWARSVVGQCKAADVPVFYKQGGAWNRCAHSSKGGHFECFPPDLQVREFPA